MNTRKIISLAVHTRIFLHFSRLAATTLLAASAFAAPANGSPQGELDTSFGENGRLMVPVAGNSGSVSNGTAIAQQVDGKLLIASGGGDFVVTRLNIDGSPDDSFGTNGIAVIDLGGSLASPTRLAVQADGKIIVAGESSIGANVDFSLVRLDPDGTLDTTFDGDGIATLDLGGDESVSGIAVLQHGQLVVTGSTNANGGQDVAFARFDVNGALDTTFGTGPIAGTTLVDSGLPDYASWMTTDPEGGYVICGWAGYSRNFQRILTVRVRPDGTADTEFGSGGVFLGTTNEVSYACTAMADGSILLAVPSGFARLTSGGMQDATFGDLGVSRISFGRVAGWVVRAMIRLNDGNLGVTGTIWQDSQFNEFYGISDMFFARIDADSGTLDRSFGNNGMTLVDFSRGSETVSSSGRALIQQADGKLVAVGEAYGFESGTASARVDPAGAGSRGFAGFVETFATVSEGTELVLIVRRTGGEIGDLSVEYNTVAGTATSPSDFTASFGTLTWTSGDMAPKSIRVPITEDAIKESEENFMVVLSNATGGLAASEFSATVADNSKASKPPSSGGSGSGGGGAMSLELLLLLALSTMLAMRGPRRGDNSMDKFKKIACLLAAGAVAACSSGGSPPDGSSVADTSTLPESPEYSGGYLYGDLYLDDASSTTYPIQIILSEDGRFRAQQLGPYGYPKTWLLLRGSFELHGRVIDGEGIAIADPRETWFDGESTTGLTISGTLDQPTSRDSGKLLVTVSMASGDTGRIDASFAQRSPYYHGSDLKRLAGTWVAEQGDNGSWYADPYGSANPPLPPPGSVQIIVQPDGAFTGTDDGGCVMIGRLSLIDTRFSLWSLDYTIRECDREGDYSGLTLGDNHWYDNRSLSFSADDGSRSQALEFWQDR